MQVGESAYCDCRSCAPVPSGSRRQSLARVRERFGLRRRAWSGRRNGTDRQHAHEH